MAYSSTIKLNLASGIKQNALAEARRIGISLQDFIRMLLSTYFAKSDSISALSREKMLFDNARKEIREKKYHEINSSSELENYLLSL